MRDDSGLPDPIMINTYRYGSPRHPGEGLRLGTTRYPPRGVSLERCAAEDFFDERVPVLAPTPELLRLLKQEEGRITETLATRYREELNEEVPSRVAELLARAYHHVPFVIGCYCSVPDECHQSILGEVLNAAVPAEPVSRDAIHQELVTFLDAFRESLDGPSERAVAHFTELAADS